MDGKHRLKGEDAQGRNMKLKRTDGRHSSREGPPVHRVGELKVRNMMHSSSSRIHVERPVSRPPVYLELTMKLCLLKTLESLPTRKDTKHLA